MVKKNNGMLFKLYAFSIFLMMCYSTYVSFTRYLSSSIVHLWLFLMPIVYMLATKLEITKKNVSFCLWIIVIYTLGLLCTQITSFFIVFGNTYTIIGICSVLLLTQNEKEQLLSFVTNCLVFILIFSIPAWILYLAGFSLPHGPMFEHENGFHVLVDYYFFYESGKYGEDMFPKFRSVFLEPGQLATPCAYLFYANGGSLKNWKNILLVLAVLLSFSLIGYGLIIGGIFLNNLFTKGKKRFWKIIIFLSIVGTITVISIKAENEDNPLYSLIIQRLEYDEDKGISGNNRTSVQFESRYDAIIHSNDKWFGVGTEMKFADNWAVNSSGVKKYIVYNGIVGLTLILLFTFLLMKRNMSSQSVTFFCVVVLAFLVRDMLRTSFWMIITILGFYSLGKNSIVENDNSSKKDQLTPQHSTGVS